MNNNIRITLFIVKIQKVYTTVFSCDLTLIDNINIFFKMINDDDYNIYLNDKHILIYEYNHNIKLNLFIKVKDLNLYFNTILVVY